MEKNKTILSKDEQNRMWELYPLDIKKKIIELYNSLPIGDECILMRDLYGYENLNTDLIEDKFRDIKWKFIDTEGNVDIYASENHYPIVKRVTHTDYWNDPEWVDYDFNELFFTDEDDLIKELKSLEGDWEESTPPRFKIGDTVCINHIYDNEGEIIDKVDGCLVNFYRIKVTKRNNKFNGNTKQVVFMSEDDLLFEKRYKEKRKVKLKK